MEIDLRTATLEDGPMLASMNRQLMEDERGPEPPPMHELESRMRRLLEAGTVGILVFHRGEIMGYGLFDLHRETDKEPWIYLRQFFICRDWRGVGVGRMVFERIAAEHFPPDAVIALDALESNARGRRFWRRLGFVPFSIRYHRRPEAPGQERRSSGAPGMERRP